MKKSRKMVRKNVLCSTITASYVSISPEGNSCMETHLQPIMLFGSINTDEAFKKLYDVYGPLPFTNINVSVVKTMYEMPLDDFLERATIKKESVTEQTAQEDNK